MASATRRRPAAASVSAPPSATPSAGSGSSVSPRLQARPGHFGSFRLQQLVLVEVAAALLLVAWVVEPMLLVPAGVVAVVLVLLAVVRRHRRSLPEWLGTFLALRARTRRSASFTVPEGTEPGFAPIVECDPALRTLTYSDRDRRPVGMVGDGTFPTAVLRVESEGTALRSDRAARPLPVGIVRDVLSVDGIRLESAQVVQHTQPAPAPHLPAQSMAARNYGPLQAQTGSPAVRITWIALKLDPELCPEAVAARRRHDGRAEVPGARGGPVGEPARGRRVPGGRADRAGAHLGACHVQLREPDGDRAGGPGPGAGAPDPGDRPDLAGGRPPAHDVLVGRWPQLGGRNGGAGASMPQLVALLTSLPALATTFSLTLSGGDRQEVTVTGHVRITGRSDEELVTARHELERVRRAG